MRNRNALPALDLLVGFEAAARHLSFTRAGEELFLTQSAVSRQIKELEDQLGVALFQRRHRALALTEHLMRHIFERGEQPFLHVFPANSRAVQIF
jgi:LysR family transcriptional regulator, glycine cleavage system transcriptional activator